MKKFLYIALFLAFVAVSIVGCSTINPQIDPEASTHNATVSPSETITAQHSEPAPTSAAPITTQSTLSSTTDYSVEKIELLQREYTLVNAKKVYGENFEIKSTLTDANTLTFIAALIDDIEPSDAQSDNWPKFNPARANEYAIKIFLNDGSITIINLHFTEQSNAYYIALADLKEDTEYNAFVTSINADKSFTKHIIKGDAAQQLIKLYN